MKDLFVCALHGAYRAMRVLDCPRCLEAARYDVIESSDGDALPAPGIPDRWCDGCGAPIDSGWLCSRCDRADLTPAERMFGSLGR